MRTTSAPTRVGLGLAALALLAGLTGCSSGGDASAAPPLITLGEGSDSFPNETLSDWVSYATQVSVVRAVSEAEIPPPPEVLERGEGYVGRRLELQVERTLWTAEGTTPATGRISLVPAGWVLEDGERVRAAVTGGPRMEVGERFVLPLTEVDGVWSLLSSSAVLPLDGDAVRPGRGQENAAVAGLAGRSTAEVRSRLRGSRPDPVAAKYAGLPPYERARAVIEEKARNGG